MPRIGKYKHYQSAFESLDEMLYFCDLSYNIITQGWNDNIWMLLMDVIHKDNNIDMVNISTI